MRKDFIVLIALVLVGMPREVFGKEKASDRERETDKKASVEEKDADDDELEESGLSLGARGGYALPVGSVAKDPLFGGVTDLSRYASGMVPFTGDVGYRLNRHFYIGGTFTFGFISTGPELCNGAQGSCSSSGNDIRAGAMLKYTFVPEKKLAPWIGVGGGYEVLNVSRTVGTVTTDASVKGWELLTVHAGLDYRAATHVTVGPVVGFSLGQYNSYSASTSTGKSASTDLNQTALHHWVFLGAGGKFDL